jgi:hypothetical protein
MLNKHILFILYHLLQLSLQSYLNIYNVQKYVTNNTTADYIKM